MSLVIRERLCEEVDLIIDYFHGATPDYLETLGVDPTRLPTRSGWREKYTTEFSKPVQERSNVPVIWELDGLAVGFSTSDKSSTASTPTCTCTSWTRNAAGQP